MDQGKKTRVSFAAFISGYLSLVTAAILTSIELGIQPMIASTADGKALYCPYNLSIAIPAMAIEHLLFFWHRRRNHYRDNCKLFSKK